VERGFDKSQATVDVLENGKTVGRVLITIDKYSPFVYRDKIAVTGLVEIPEKTNNFDYAGYLSKDGVSAIMSYPQMELISQGNYDNVFQKIAQGTYSFKNRMGETVRKYIPSNLSPIMEGLI